MPFVKTNGIDSQPSVHSLRKRVSTDRASGLACIYFSLLSDATFRLGQTAASMRDTSGQSITEAQVATRIVCLGAIVLVSLGSLLGCSSELDPKECDKIRGEAFDLVNAAQHCNVDADCSQSTWPGCARAVNAKTTATIAPMAEKFKQGQCKETPLQCKAPPEAYCKQGLCVHREKGVPEGAGEPAGDIIIK